MDGLIYRTQIAGHKVRCEYHVASDSASIESISINGAPYALKLSTNPYREGGALIPRSVLSSCPQGESIKLKVTLA